MMDIEHPGGVLLFAECYGQRRWLGTAPTIDRGFGKLAALAQQRLQVSYVPEGERLAPALRNDATIGLAQALILPMGPQGQSRLDDDEIKAIHDFVRAGGGLLVLGAYTGDWHHEANFNRLLQDYGIAFNRDVILPGGATSADGFIQGGERSPASTCAVRATASIDAASPADKTSFAALSQGASSIVTLSSCSLALDEGLAVPLYQTDADATQLEPIALGIGILIQRYIVRGQGAAVMLAAARNAKVIVAGSWKLFLDAFFDHPHCDNRALAANLLAWLTTPARHSLVPPAPSETRATASGVDQQALSALQERLRQRRKLLLALEREAILTTGYEKAVLGVRIEELQRKISEDEAEIDALSAP